MPWWSSARRCAKSSAAAVAITPLAMWASFVPVTAITPQPVRDRPGSNPTMRMVVTNAPENRFLSVRQARRRTQLRCAELLHQRVAHLVIGVDVLDVVVVVEN